MLPCLILIIYFHAEIFFICCYKLFLWEILFGSNKLLTSKGWIAWTGWATPWRSRLQEFIYGYGCPLSYWWNSTGDSFDFLLLESSFINCCCVSCWKSHGLYFFSLMFYTIHIYLPEGIDHMAILYRFFIMSHIPVSGAYRTPCWFLLVSFYCNW